MRARCSWLLVAIVLGCGQTEGDAPAEKPTALPAAAPSEAKDATPEPIEAPAQPPKKAPHFGVQKKVETTVNGKGDGPYHFTAAWHRRRIKSWSRILASYRGRKNLEYLEVGVFEGRSLIFMLETILTHDSSRATAIDVFMGDYEQTFDRNVKASGASKRVTKIKDPSYKALRDLEFDRYDIIYIDGSHTADDVLADAVLSWPLLKSGGLIIFDDYNWIGRPDGGPIAMELRPRVAVDAFITAFRSEIEIVHRDYQVVLRKHPNPCKVKDYCTPVGQYLYFWREFELREPGGEVVALSEKERIIIEMIAKSKRLGDVGYSIPPKRQNDQAFKDLVAKLDLKLIGRPKPPRDETKD